MVKVEEIERIPEGPADKALVLDATARQVESLVTEPLERIMKEMPGVRHVYSATMRGQAIVTVRFLVGEDMGESIVKVHDKLQSNMDKIPPDVRMPLVKPVGVDDVPVVTATLWSDQVDDSQLRTLALDVLQELGEVKNTGKGFVVGGRADQIRVEVLMERAGLGVALAAVRMGIGYGSRVVVLAGVGNNGGDGLVAAHIIARVHSEVEGILPTAPSA